LLQVTENEALGNDLLRAAARLSRWASRHAAFDVPFAQARLLALLDELGPSRISTLAEADNSSQPSMTAQVQRVEAAGWARREPDPDDSRAVLVSLTPAGARKLLEVRHARAAVLEPALSQLAGPSAQRVHDAVAVLEELLTITSTRAPTPRKDG
jgi:DNA-binding MarR family transcriptional regulator